MSPDEHKEIIGRLEDIHSQVQKIDRVLSGEPEYKREGLVETVDRHENYIKKGTAIIGFLYIVWEGFKFLRHGL